MNGAGKSVKGENRVAAGTTTIVERGWRISESMKGFLFVAPSLALLFAFAAYPLASSLRLSLQEVQVFSNQHDFVGFKNYTELLASNDFWSSLWKGLVFSAATVLLQLLAGIGTALLLDNRFRGRALVRGLILFPFVVPTIV